MSPSPVTILSKCTIHPDQPSAAPDLKLSVSDLPMLSCHYIQKGLLFPPPQIPSNHLLTLLKSSLARALSFFPPLAGRLSTDPDGTIFIACNDSGVEFTHAVAPKLTAARLLPPVSITDTPAEIRCLFVMDGTVSFQGHFRPLAAFQFTELGDGAVFVGCTINHAVVDGTSFWNFFNAWAEICRNSSSSPAMPVSRLTRYPNFRRNYFGESKAVLRFADGRGPEVTFDANAPLRERIFHFGREAIVELKSRANLRSKKLVGSEVYCKQIHDPKFDEVSSFQSLCALLWISITRARKSYLQPESDTTFRMAVNCRQRVTPKVDPLYFGNAIQSIPMTAKVGDVTENGLAWAAGLLHKGVVSHVDQKVRKVVADWEAAPRCFPLGNPDGAGVTMGSSPRFPMYEGNDFGWGQPLALRSGKANKFNGKISAFPGRSGNGSVELEVCLLPETMAALVEDEEFMSYVTEVDVSGLTA